jgi:ubiquinone/menaquinone biosynthesis C-methylase UbiE
MVSLQQTSKKYRGRKAETYEDIRKKQARWNLENETVGAWIAELKPRTVLDVPVGTGRFFEDYAKASCTVLGIDISEAMLDLAKKKLRGAKAKHIQLEQGSATNLEVKDKSADMVICVRFLDLIDQDGMRATVKEICRVAKKNIVCTIRFGEKYLPKSNTSEHAKRPFLALIRQLGWDVEETVLFRGGNWHILLLGRK